MQTPISFALNILLDCDTIEKAHKACRKYIKDLEREPKTQQHHITSYRNDVMTAAPQQAPSTQKLLEQHGLAQSAAPLTAAPVINRVVGGEVSTGNGTRGPRKF